MNYVSGLRLEEAKTKARSEAWAAAQLQVQEQVNQTLEVERAGHVEQLRNALLTERMKCEDERLIAQVYVSTQGCGKGVPQAGSGRGHYGTPPPCESACCFFGLSI